MRALLGTAVWVSSALLAGCSGCVDGPWPPLGNPGAACDPTHHTGSGNRLVLDGGAEAACTRTSELHVSCEERFRQGGSLDIVWVVDNSPSMDEEIGGIQDNLNRFAQQVTATGLDYHVVLVSGGPGDAHGLCVQPPLAGANCGDSDRFRHIKKAVDSTDGPKVLLDFDNVVEDFLRPEAQTHVVFVTDDNSEMGADEFRAALPGRAPGLQHATFHGVVGLDLLDCPTIAAVGSVYASLARATGGVLVPICCQDYAKVVQVLADDLAASSLRFLLLRPPTPGSVEVFLEDASGTRTPAAPSGWQYDAAQQAVVFQERARPAPGTVVAIRYTTAG